MPIIKCLCSFTAYWNVTLITVNDLFIWNYCGLFVNEFFNSYKANDREPGSIQIFRVTSQAMTVTIIVDYSRIGVKRKHYSFHSDRIVLIARLTWPVLTKSYSFSSWWLSLPESLMVSRRGFMITYANSHVAQRVLHVRRPTMQFFFLQIIFVSSSFIYFFFCYGGGWSPWIMSYSKDHKVKILI